MSARDLAATVRTDIMRLADGETTEEMLTVEARALAALAALEKQAADAQEKTSYVESCRDDMHDWAVRAEATVRSLRDQMEELLARAVRAEEAQASAESMMEAYRTEASAMTERWVRAEEALRQILDADDLIYNRIATDYFAAAGADTP